MEIALKTFYRVPLLGWLVKDAIHGLPDAKYYFIANLFALVCALIYKFGYPFLIVFALTGTGLYLTFLVLLTASDLVRRPRQNTGSDR